MRTHIALFFFLLTVLAVRAIARTQASEVDAIVEVEEDVYTYVPASNGSGPMWCFGNTSIVRVGDNVFASGLETIEGAKLLNNCVPLLFRRSEGGWSQVFRGSGRTREPSPLAMFPSNRVFLSVNPTLTPADTYSGPADPEILEFGASAPGQRPRSLEPVWAGEPKFTEHSYRSFVADGARGELLLLQNIGYTHAQWCFRDGGGQWSAQGKLIWPWGADYERRRRSASVTQRLRLTIDRFLSAA